MTNIKARPTSENGEWQGMRNCEETQERATCRHDVVKTYRHTRTQHDSDSTICKRSCEKEGRQWDWCIFCKNFQMTKHTHISKQRRSAQQILTRPHLREERAVWAAHLWWNVFSTTGLSACPMVPGLYDDIVIWGRERKSDEPSWLVLMCTLKKVSGLLVCKSSSFWTVSSRFHSFSKRNVHIVPLKNSANHAMAMRDEMVSDSSDTKVENVEFSDYTKIFQILQASMLVTSVINPSSRPCSMMTVIMMTISTVSMIGSPGDSSPITKPTAKWQEVPLIHILRTLDNNEEDWATKM